MMRAGIQGRGELTRSLTAILIVTGMVVTSAAARAAEEKGQRKPEVVPNEYVVKLRQPIGDVSLQSASALIGAPIVERISEDMVLVRKKGDFHATDMMRSLAKNSAVALVEPNYIYRMSRVPNDPDLFHLWGLKNRAALDKDGTRGLANVDVGAEKAWDITTGSKDILVAVIDTGVAHTHPDLAVNMWVNQLEKNGQAGVDDDGNGYVDDVHGYDFANDDADPMDDNGHGTHVAGTIGATGNDGKGLVGVNWDVSIMGVKFLSGEGGGTLANAIKCINYATMMGVDVMNNSWGGGGYSDILKDTIQRARRAGIVFVAAAGNSAVNNDTAKEYPASYEVDNIISVAAVDNRGDLAYFSNYGASSVHVAAPGHNILSSIPTGQDVYSGTSMAAPHVTGVVALMLAHNPDLSYRDIKERLIRTSKPIAALKGRVVSGGLVDAFYAMVDIRPPADPNDPTVWSEKREEIVETAHPYPDSHEQTWTIRVPGAKRVSAHFKKFDTERRYDKLQFFNALGESLGTWSGQREESFSPIADGDTLELKFSSDTSVSGHGFEIDYIVFE
ncbi:MAG: S8 family serine peptidase [Bdellovibrionaceae bacterium]|nr:S8 family serine peptidase [Pseudobdellovibrionaceae bacterium]